VWLIERVPDGRVIADEAEWARTPLARARGLLGRSPLRRGQALILEPGRQVHSFGLKYPIDVVFCDGDWAIVLVYSLAPYRLSPWIRAARRVIELPEGGTVDLAEGDHLRVTDRD
jgi:uncharacterized membrane protein (UPF0127 family)